MAVDSTGFTPTPVPTFKAARVKRSVNALSVVMRPACHTGWFLVGRSNVPAQPGDLIPSIRRGGNLPAPERRAQAELVAIARLGRIYGHRWKCETVHSVIKRKFGSTVRSRSVRLQQREPAVKAVVYNLHV